MCDFESSSSGVEYKTCLLGLVHIIDLFLKSACLLGVIATKDMLSMLGEIRRGLHEVRSFCFYVRL